MSNQASRVNIRNLPPTIPSQQPLQLAVLLGVGVTEWGPFTPTVVSSFDEFKKVYGSYLANYDLAIQVDTFFREGGRKAVIQRIRAAGQGAQASATLQTGATAATVGSVLASNTGPYALANGDTLIVSVDGEANQTLTISAVAAVDTSGSAPFALSDGQTLTVSVDGGVAQTVTLSGIASPGAATAQELADNLNAQVAGASAAISGSAVELTSDTLGTDSGIEITGGTGAAAAGFGAAASGSGNVADASSVSATELGALCAAAFTNGGGVTAADVSGALQLSSVTTGALGSVQVIASSTIDDDLGLDNVAHPGFSGLAQNTLLLRGKYIGDPTLTYSVTAASSGKAEEFDLYVYKKGTQVEHWPNQTMDSAATRYVVDFLSKYSYWLEGVDQSATGTATQRRPANATAQALTGGDDGLTGLAVTDYEGLETDQTGIQALTNEAEGLTLICPDEPTAGFATAAKTWCEGPRKGKTIYIPDAPSGESYSTVQTHAATLVATDTRTAVYWPNIKRPNPDPSVYGNVDYITIGCSGFIAGRIALNGERELQSVGLAPGNEVTGRSSVAIDVEDRSVNHSYVREQLAAANVNAVVAKKDSDGIFGVWSDDVLGGDPDADFSTVGEQMLVATFKNDIARYLERQRNTPNTPEARLDDQKRISSYFEAWAENQVFDSPAPGEGYYVDTDVPGEGLNNAVIRQQKRYQVAIGVNTAPARRIIDLLFSRDTHGTNVSILRQQASL
jgi:hypothetical protein